MTIAFSASRIARMYRRGMTITQIADDLHISRQTVHRKLVEANEPRRLPADTMQMFRAAKKRLEARKEQQA